MRLAPVALFYAADVGAAVARSGESSKTTHAAATAVDACRYLGALIAGAAGSVAKEELLMPQYWRYGPLAAEIEEVAQGSFRRREPPHIQGSGYVVRSLEAALWALDKSETFRDGALLAVNLGDDADTTGAVYGQLAGAIYGEHGIPEEWRDKLALRNVIEDLADRLFAERHCGESKQSS
jgi:ADP-ribosyl-[dinitrogen reductase] hydrolase